MSRRPNTEAREKILRTAYELFLSEGFDAVSMEDIARAAGLKKSNLFHYYPCKEDLGKAVVEKAARKHAEGMRALFTERERDPLAVVEELFDRGTAGMGDCSRGCFIGKMGQEIGDGNAAMRRLIRECFMEWQEDIASFLDGWKHKGYFRGDFHPREAAGGILALYEGGVLVAKVLGDRKPLDHARRAAVTVIVAWKG